MVEDCVFCKIVRGEIPAEKFYESDNFIVIPDAHPVVKGHMLVIPRKHFVTLIDLPSSLGGELIGVVKEVAGKKLKEEFGGFNIVQNNFRAGGQVVNHVHVHLIPRREDDGVKVLE